MDPCCSILNLFSRDTYVVDQILGWVIQNMVRTSAVCASIVLVIGFSFPPFLIAVVPLTWFYYRVTVYEWLYYFWRIILTPALVTTSRHRVNSSVLMRCPARPSLHGSRNHWLDYQPSGPLINNPSSLQTTLARIDRNQLCYLPSTAVNRWLAVRLEFVGAIIIVTMLAVSAVVNSNVDAGLVGLVLSYALNTTGSLVGNYFCVSESGLLSGRRIGSSAQQVK